MSIRASHQFLAFDTEEAVVETCGYKSISLVPFFLGIAEAVVETNVFKSISPSTGTDEA